MVKHYDILLSTVHSSKALLFKRMVILNLQLPMQSGIIITQAVSSNPHYFHKYLGCTHCLIKFVILVRPINGFLRISSNSKTHRHNIAAILMK
jgi:hypothetical protein